MQQPRQAIISFEAARLVINSVLLLALLGEFLLGGPRTRPHRRIFDRDGVFEGLRPGARPTLDQMKILARALIIGLRTEVRHVDDEAVTLPMTARIAVPLSDVSGKMRAPVQADVALPSLSLTHVVEHRDAAWCLHDAAEAAAERRSKFGQPAGQTTLRQRGVFRTVMAIHPPGGVVAGRSFRTSRRGRRIVFPAAAFPLLILARLGRLQHGGTKLLIGGCNLPNLRHQPRNLAIGPIDD